MIGGCCPPHKTRSGHRRTPPSGWSPWRVPSHKQASPASPHPCFSWLAALGSWQTPGWQTPVQTPVATSWLTEILIHQALCWPTVTDSWLSRLLAVSGCGSTCCQLLLALHGSCVQGKSGSAVIFSWLGPDPGLATPPPQENISLSRGLLHYIRFTWLLVAAQLWLESSSSKSVLALILIGLRTHQLADGALEMINISCLYLAASSWV